MKMSNYSSYFDRSGETFSVADELFLMNVTTPTYLYLSLDTTTILLPNLLGYSFYLNKKKGDTK